MREGVAGPAGGTGPGWSMPGWVRGVCGVVVFLSPGLRMNVTLIVYAAIWPVLFNTISGLDDVDPVARETLRAFGFGRLGVITLVDLPSASPFIATGIRLASSIAIILNISTGYLTGRISGNGIGAFIAEANTGA